MNPPTIWQVRRLAREIVRLLPADVIAVSQVTCVLYDDRVVLVGLTIRSGAQAQTQQALLSAKPQIALRLHRSIQVKRVNKGALVVASLQMNQIEDRVTAIS